MLVLLYMFSALFSHSHDKKVNRYTFKYTLLTSSQGCTMSESPPWWAWPALFVVQISFSPPRSYSQTQFLKSHHSSLSEDKATHPLHNFLHFPQSHPISSTYHHNSSRMMEPYAVCIKNDKNRHILLKLGTVWFIEAYLIRKGYDRRTIPM